MVREQQRLPQGEAPVTTGLLHRVPSQASQASDGTEAAAVMSHGASGFRANLVTVPVRAGGTPVVQGKRVGGPVGNRTVPPMQLQASGEREDNRTGMPDRLKSGLEQMSGMDLSAVRVHYNSAKPAQLNAHAYAQGTDIHLGPGQAQHLPHEAWHVVQQAQGRVKPTMQMGGAAINDDGALEREADRMGSKAVMG